MSDEIEGAKKYIKDRFITANKEYLDVNNYSVLVHGWVQDYPTHHGDIFFRIALLDKDNKDVAIDFSKIK